mmetsp:Transcript_36528/g.83945  ORF Transcript_36528/g.83945 Transcript_36528/m.83945 type:complete len:398 (+) Transcript_36528:92-1285(+)
MALYSTWALLTLLCWLRRVACLDVVGYLPEYRFSSVDWDGLVRSVSHLVLFSLEPSALGEVDGLDRMWPLADPDSALNVAMRNAGPQACKVLLCLGGAGRSEHFPQIFEKGKLRKKLARSLSNILDMYPMLAGVDIDWEAPSEPEHWKGLANFANLLRSQWGNESKEHRLLTMTFHPRSGATDAMKSMASKSGKSFPELFDLMHAMAYTYYDNERRHSTLEQAVLAIEECERAGLPLSRVSLGVPFFGVSRRHGKTYSYGEIMDMDSSVRLHDHIDFAVESTYFNNRGTMTQKLQLAARKGLAGIMIWELGQDKPLANSRSMLRHIASTVAEINNPSWRSSWLQYILLSEEQATMAAAMGMGLVFLFRVVTSKPAHQKSRREQQAKKEAKQDEAAAN